MLALQALLRLKNIDAKSSEYTSRIVDFALKVPTSEMSGAIKNVVTEECSKLLNGASIAKLVSDLAAKARSDPSTPLPLRIEIARSLVSTKSEPIEKASSVIVDSGAEMRGFDIRSCRLALATLKDFGSEASAAVERWKVFVKEHYPLAKDFS